MKKSNKGFLQGEALKGIFDGGASLIKKQQMEHLIQYLIIKWSIISNIKYN